LLIPLRPDHLGSGGNCRIPVAYVSADCTTLRRRRLVQTLSTSRSFRFSPPTLVVRNSLSGCARHSKLLARKLDGLNARRMDWRKQDTARHAAVLTTPRKFARKRAGRCHGRCCIALANLLL